MLEFMKNEDAKRKVKKTNIFNKTSAFSSHHDFIFQNYISCNFFYLIKNKNYVKYIEYRLCRIWLRLKAHTADFIVSFLCCIRFVFSRVVYVVHVIV